MVDVVFFHKQSDYDVTLAEQLLHVLNPNSPFAHCIHVHAHSRDLATAVLVKFVATCLTSEAVKKKLLAKITVRQLEEGFSYLRR